MSVWTPERVAKMERLLGEGLTAAEVGTALGCSRNAVLGKSFRLRQSDLDGPRPPRGPALEPEWWARAQAYAADGHSAEMIAVLCDRSVSGVHKAINPAYRERQRQAEAARRRARQTPFETTSKESRT